VRETAAGRRHCLQQELEARDYYTEKNVFWVPALARWDFIRANAKVAPGTKLEVKNGMTSEYDFKGTGRLIDDALEAIGAPVHGIVSGVRTQARRRSVTVGVERREYLL